MPQQTIPATGFLRLWQIIGDAKRGVAPILPISPSKWYAGVAEGIYPKGELLSPRTRVYPVESIRELIDRINAGLVGGK
jgi:prophage regulatory protein